MGPAQLFGWPDIRRVPVYIYALVESDTGAIRYVGRSEDPHRRMVYYHGKECPKPIRAWHLSLLDRGADIEQLLLDVAKPGENAEEKEQFYIFSMLRAGENLINTIIPKPTDTSERFSDGLVRLTFWFGRISREARHDIERRILEEARIHKVPRRIFCKNHGELWKVPASISGYIEKITDGFVPTDSWDRPCNLDSLRRLVLGEVAK